MMFFEDVDNGRIVRVNTSAGYDVLEQFKDGLWQECDLDGSYAREYWLGAGNCCLFEIDEEKALEKISSQTRESVIPSNNPITEVVAALIWQGEKFMICQRPAHKARGLLWEFVGGKVEPGETKEQALTRECREELNVLLSVGDIFMEVIHEYPDITVHLTLFNATIAEGEPQKLEHNDIQWITPSEIPNYEFCPADEEILKKIIEERG